MKEVNNVASLLECTNISEENANTDRLNLGSSPLTKEHTIMASGSNINGAIEPSAADEANSPRKNYLEWDEYFMAVSFLSAQRSKDPATQVGACIVNPDRRIVGIGYNGMPRGCNDAQMPWGKTSHDELENKYMYVCHAEMNAIMNKNSASVEGCTIYVALFPCNECSKLIIQSGIREVIYFSDKHADKKSTIASKRLLEIAGVKFRQFIPRMPKLTIDFHEADPTVFKL